MTVEKAEQNDSADVLAQLKALSEQVTALQDENKVLKAHADETIKEKKAMKARLDEDEAARAKELEEKVNRTKDENEQLIKQYKDKLAAAEQVIADGKQKEYQNSIKNEAKKLAEQLTKDSVRQELLIEKFEKRIKLQDDGSIQVLDDKGNATISKVDALVNDVKQRYSFLVDGLDSTGGGAHSSGGAPAQKLSEMNEQERVQLFRTDNAKYRELEKLEN